MKQAVLLLSVLLVGCGSVPHVTVVEPASVFSVEITGSAAPGASAGGTMAAAPPPIMMAPPPPRIKGGFAPSPSKEQPSILDELTSMDAGAAMPIVKKVTKTTKTVTKSKTGDEVTTVVEETIEEVLPPQVEPEKEVDWFEKIVSNLTKLIALLTGTLGLYVGVQKLRQPASPLPATA